MLTFVMTQNDDITDSSIRILGCETIDIISEVCKHLANGETVTGCTADCSGIRIKLNLSPLIHRRPFPRTDIKGHNILTHFMRICLRINVHIH